MTESNHIGNASAVTLIRKASVPQADSGAVTTQDILIIDGKIAAIDSDINASSYGPGVNVVDAHGLAIMPGLVNSHTHSHFAFGRGFGDLWSLETHLNSGSGINYGATLEEMRIASQLIAADMIRHGCTAAYDMVVQAPYTSPEGMQAVATGYQNAGIKAVVAATVTDKPFWETIPGLMTQLSATQSKWVRDMVRVSSREHLAGLRAALESWPFSPNSIKLGLAPSVPMLCTNELLEGVAALASEFNAPMQTHLAESKVQTMVSEKRWQGSLTRRLADIGFFDGKVSAAHAIWLDESDLDTLAEHDVAIAHNPASNLRLGNGVAPVASMLARGVKVGLGTDACSCADQQNMVDAMRLAAYSARSRGPDAREWLTTRQIFKMATENGAELLGFAETGQFTVGMAADLVLVDLSDLAYVPLNDFWNQLVFSDSGRAVHTVLVDGEIVYKNGRFTRFDYDTLCAEAHEASARLAQYARDRRDTLKSMEPVVTMFCAGLAQQPFRINQFVEGVSS